MIKQHVAGIHIFETAKLYGIGTGTAVTPQACLECVECCEQFVSLSCSRMFWSYCVTEVLGCAKSLQSPEIVRGQKCERATIVMVFLLPALWEEAYVSCLLLPCHSSQVWLAPDHVCKLWGVGLACMYAKLLEFVIISNTTEKAIFSDLE